VSEQDAAGFWDAWYAERDQIWSGEPNHALVAVVAGLHPGRALDLGCGEGADSVWLAEQGWLVTGLDIAATAVARAITLAASREIPDGRITWIVEDLRAWQPSDAYELVSACFLPSRVDFPRATILQRAASAVAPGGHLLLVGHVEFPPWAELHDHGDHRFLTTAEEIAALELGGDKWDTVLAEVRPRQVTGPQGERATLDDMVVLIRRL